MNAKMTIKALILALLIVFAASYPAAAMQNAPVFNYGASCFNPYGAARKKMSFVKTTHAVEEFFKKKGLEVRFLGHNRRFIRAVIYKGDKQVDSIIVDIRTGRMRSIQ